MEYFNRCPEVIRTHIVSFLEPGEEYIFKGVLDIPCRYNCTGGMYGFIIRKLDTRVHFRYVLKILDYFHPAPRLQLEAGYLDACYYLPSKRIQPTLVLLSRLELELGFQHHQALAQMAKVERQEGEDEWLRWHYSNHTGFGKPRYVEVGIIEQLIRYGHHDTAIHLLNSEPGFKPSTLCLTYAVRHNHRPLVDLLLSMACPTDNLLQDIAETGNAKLYRELVSRFPGLTGTQV